VQDLAENMWFSADLHQGSLQSPIPFTLKTSSLVGEAISEQSFDVQPNPFNDQTLLRFSLPSAQEVNISICNMSGAEVSRLRTQARQGINTLMWDGADASGQRLGSGVYFVRLSTEGGFVTKKVVIQR
jgi:flagellar hook assembly protein FlgD